MATLTKDEILDAISGMTVLELSELLTAFGLIAGGTIFMASVRCFPSLNPQIPFPSPPKEKDQLGFWQHSILPYYLLYTRDGAIRRNVS